MEKDAGKWNEPGIAMKLKIRHISILLILIIIISLLSSCENPNARESRPNVVLMIADDLAWDDLGCYGHPTIQTPNIDKLASNGMRFDNAFLTASSCSPSRSSIITGKYPHQTSAEQLHWPLPADQVTFVEKLKEAGYWTGQAGKWHLGDAVKDRFDKIMEVPVGGFQLKEDGTMVTTTNESGCEDWVAILNSRDKNKPFFLWLAAVDPHRDYKSGIIQNPHSLDKIIVPPYIPDTKEVREDLALYYDEISRLDSFVGDFINELERQQLSENTLVLFISDNGRPFPRDKTTLYDGGIKTPWIVRWPGKAEFGSESNSLVSSVDIAPTFLKLAGVAEHNQFEGKDFSGILVNPKNKIRTSIYAEDHWHDFEDFSRAVRTEKYKYIRNFYPDLPNTPSADALRSPTFRTMQKLKNEGKLSQEQMTCFIAPRPKEELYDIESDPFERDNLAENAEFTEILDELREEMYRIRTETNDSIPSKRTPDEFDRETGQPNKYRIRPRPSKAEMWRVYEKGN
ncbi:sulfatase [Draconibacterium sp.]|nr:sulfatase [Draconibacterium sp.]